MIPRNGGILFCLVGPAGSGKTSLARRLKSDFEGSLDVAVSVTTRTKRPFEVDGTSYFFVGEKEFLALKEKDKLFECEKVHGNWYGQKRETLEAIRTKKIDVVLDIDINGAFSIKGGYPAETVIVFLLPPSLEALRERLMNRSPVSESELASRLATAEHEYKTFLASHKQDPSVDYVLVNETLEFCYQELKDILLAERKRFARLSLDEVKTYCSVG